MTTSDEQPGAGSDPQDPGTAAGQDAGPAAGEPAKKHGDPLLNEAEGEHGPVDVPEVGKGTADSASAG